MDRVTPVPRAVGGDMEPVILRLQGAAPCSPELVRRVEALGARIETAPSRSVLQAEDAPVRRPRYLLSGWACRFRLLSDGRKQIFDFVLPGEGVGVCLRPHPLAATGTAALTPVRLADASALLQGETLDAFPDLRQAVQAQADADERRMLNQIVRLGRLTALERLAHLFLELHERLAVVGSAQNDRFPLPLTQETLADAMGLSVVHVNRTLQELRRQNLVVQERGFVRLPNPAALAQTADYDRGGRPGPTP